MIQVMREDYQKCSIKNSDSVAAILRLEELCR